MDAFILATRGGRIVGEIVERDILWKKNMKKARG